VQGDGEMSYTDEELLASVRSHAFEALVTVTLLRHHDSVKAELRPHFENVLNLIDGMDTN
jgi:hypothetical protein